MLRTNHPAFVARASTSGYNLRILGSITDGLLLWVPVVDGQRPPTDIWGKNTITPVNDGIDLGGAIDGNDPKWMGTSSRLITNKRYLQTSLLQANVSAYTIMAWVRSKIPQMGVLVNARGSGAGLSLTLAIPPTCNGSTGHCPGSSMGVPAFGLDSNAIWIGMNGTRFVADGCWHHVAGTFGSTIGQAVVPSDFNVYVDGVLDNGPSESIGSALSPLTGSGGIIIGYHEAWDAYLEASMFDLRIYGRALTAMEIARITGGSG